MREPVASVVVATHNRKTLLQETVAALEQQVDVASFEVIIVDDGSRDGTPEVLAALAERNPSIVPIVLPSNRGPGHARNAGWRAGRAPVVAFTDDDCRPVPGWLAALLAAIDDADLVQGRTLPDPDQLVRQGPFSRTMRVEFEEGYYETCNIAYRREILESQDGFDESFHLPYGEDTDLAWRAKKDGARTAFAEDALVYHEVFPSRYLDHLRDMGRRGSTVQLFTKHPELRAHLRKKLFYRPLHQQALIALGALVVLGLRPSSPVRWGGATSAGLFYAWTCRRYRPRPPRRRQWVAVVPLAFIADLYDLAVMARASVRYRTLLL